MLRDDGRNGRTPPVDNCVGIDRRPSSALGDLDENIVVARGGGRSIDLAGPYVVYHQSHVVLAVRDD